MKTIEERAENFKTRSERNIKRYREKHADKFKDYAKTRKDYSKEYYRKKKLGIDQSVNHLPIVDQYKRYRKTADRWLTNYVKSKTETDELFTMKNKLRNRVCGAFKQIGQNKPAHTESLLGCTWQEAKDHFEKLFQPGMTWANHGTWHIDHIKPVALFTEDNLHEMNHISNLQPLWAVDNILKSNNYTQL
jgi:hypothetical protein